jgi:hypothetical protein
MHGRLITVDVDDCLRDTVLHTGGAVSFSPTSFLASFGNLYVAHTLP